MANVDFNVTMQNGTGMGVFINVEDNNLFFKQSGTKTISLDPDDYTATVSGNEPSSSTVDINIVENGESIGQQSFSSQHFSGFIPFTVK